MLEVWKSVYIRWKLHVVGGIKVHNNLQGLRLSAVSLHLNCAFTVFQGCFRWRHRLRIIFLLIAVRNCTLQQPKWCIVPSFPWTWGMNASQSLVLCFLMHVTNCVCQGRLLRSGGPDIVRLKTWLCCWHCFCQRWPRPWCHLVSSAIQPLLLRHGYELWVFYIFHYVCCQMKKQKGIS